MKLTKKHLNKLFDVDGADGSWCWKLIDIKDKELLFYSLDGKYWIDTNKYSDWKYFKSKPLSKNEINYAWDRAYRGRLNEKI